MGAEAPPANAPRTAMPLTEPNLVSHNESVSDERESVDDEDDDSEEFEQYIESWLVSLSVGKRDARLYAAALIGEGFDSPDAISTLAPEDFERCGVKTGHMRLVQRDLARQDDIAAREPSSAQTHGVGWLFSTTEM